MVLAEIVNTCSHEKIAAAAIASLGPDFRLRMERTAADSGLSAGAFAALCVKRYAAQADGSRLKALQLATARQDTPILAGLRHILEAEEGARPFERGDPRIAFLPRPSAFQATMLGARVAAG